MSDASKYNFPKAKKVQVFEQVDTYIEHNYAQDLKFTEALDQLRQVLEELHHKPSTPTESTEPEASNPEIIEAEFEEIKLNEPERFQSLIDLLGILFSGGTEAIKAFYPLAGIPIEVGRKLYEIYTRNPKQLPRM